MKRFLSAAPRKLAILTAVLLCALLLPGRPQAQGPTVRFLLFYSDTCPHCETVLKEVLPPLQEKYGPQLQVRKLEIGDPDNYDFLLKLEDAYRVPPEIVGIPEIFIGSEYLIGSIEADEKLDGLVKKYLDQGGVEYPSLEAKEKLSPAPGQADETALELPDNTTLSEKDRATVALYVFWDSKCGPCLKLMNEVLPDILSRYPKDQVMVESRNLEHGSYTLMRDLEIQFGLEIGSMPEVFIGTEALLGLEEIQARLPELIDQYLASGGVDLPESKDSAASPAATPTVGSLEGSEEKHPIHLAYFYQVGCKECDRAQLDLEFLQQRYPQLDVEMFDSWENAALLEQLGARADVPESRRLLAPTVFVGDGALILEEVHAGSLQSLVEQYLPTGAPPFWRDDTLAEGQAATTILDRFRSFGWITVAVAGLIDGLNPCAFATVVFFISYLAFVGRRGKEVLAIGLVFTLGVFLTYLGVGFGFLQAVAALPIITNAGPYVYGFTALLCFALAVFSVYDFWQARRGRPEDMRLKLPTYLRKRINRIIRDGAGMKAFVPVAFATGVAISLIELACTGQIYLPVIIFVLGVPEMRAQAMSLLLLYNLMFIVPLVVVFLAAYWGTTSERMGIFISRHASAVKLATAVLFLAMGVWLVSTIAL